MKCPNCHGDIEESLVTCPMCGHILDYDRLDINRDLDKVSRMLFIFRHNTAFILKVFVLSAIIISIVFTVILLMLSDLSFNFGTLFFSLIIAIVAFVLLIIVIKERRRW